MKRMILYVLIIAAVFVLPVKPTETENLEPIQAVWLCLDNENIILQTDTENQGIGKSVAESLENMKLHSDRLVYLDTAQFLLVSENAVDRIAEIEPYLKGSVKICLWDGTGEIAEASRYMQTHKIGSRLSCWQPETKLPVLPL